MEIARQNRKTNRSTGEVPIEAWNLQTLR